MAVIGQFNYTSKKTPRHIALQTGWDYPTGNQQSDYVDENLLSLTDGGMGLMERVKEKMEQARQQRKILQKKPQAQTKLNTTPIAVLKVGAQVEYISEIDGWYYVNTESAGKGWCASSYLSSL